MERPPASHAGTPEYTKLRATQLADVQGRIAGSVTRIKWPADQICKERQSRLRKLLRTAKETSPWHRERLSGIDAENFREEELDALPPMTKADLMENFDQIVTDSRLKLSVVNEYLSNLTDDAYLFDEYHAIASGGSSGQRGVFVYDREAWTECFLTFRASLLAFLRSDLQAGPVAQILAPQASHLTSAIAQTFFPSGHRFPVSTPLAQLVDGLNRLQPLRLSTYPSILFVLAREARAGRLRISPRWIQTGAEPLLSEIRDSARDAWGVEVVNSWGLSEVGIAAWGCGASVGMHLNEDLVIVEPIDALGRHVPAGTPSTKIYLTNLFNHTLPLIRYEVSDEVTELDEPCVCGSTLRRIADVQGRSEDCFAYSGNITIHPVVFATHLSLEPNILEYQVCQTPRGASIAVRCSGAIDIPQLRTSIVKDLCAQGLIDPAVEISAVNAFERTAAGKLKRFIALGRAHTINLQRSE
jgi:phenylacetate-CoA ligase